MFVALTLLFLNTGPLNAAMANVLPAQLRGWGFAINTMAIHLLGDAASPTLIGVASDRWASQLPVLVTVTLPVAGGPGAAGGARRAGARPGPERRPMSDLTRASSRSPRRSRARPRVLVRSYHGKTLVIESKAGNEPVTEADQAANALIVERLARRLPRRRHPLRGDPRRRARASAARGSGWSIRSTAPATSSWATPASW